VDAYVQQLADTHADAFLDFLTHELHHHLQSQFRVSNTGHGLFGYSYGGLFAIYAWLRGAGPFATVGAGSPGIVDPKSQVFNLLRGLPERSEGSDTPHLHVTLNKAEVLGDIPVYRGLARNVLDFLEELHATGRSQVVSRSLLNETHVTGVQASFLSYLKACHVR
jgi:uncharacterized protein